MATVQRYWVAYLFVSFAVGVACLGVAVGQAVRRRDAVCFKGSGLVELRWFWDQNVTAFVPESYGWLLGNRQLGHFTSGVAQGEVNLLVGLPVGMGMRFGVDFDSDGFLNQDDTND